MGNIVKRIRRAIYATVRLTRKKPHAFPLVKCVTALADHIGHRTASHQIDLELRVLVGLQPRNSSLGIREKKKPAVFSAELQIFDHGIFKRRSRWSNIKRGISRGELRYVDKRAMARQ